jgi:hypothetical protein
MNRFLEDEFVRNRYSFLKQIFTMIICYLSVTQELEEYSSYQKADNPLQIKKICVGLWDLMVYYRI